MAERFAVMLGKAPLPDGSGNQKLSVTPELWYHKGVDWESVEERDRTIIVQPQHQSRQGHYPGRIPDGTVPSFYAANRGGISMKARILVVEDDATLRVTLAYLLIYAGYSVTQAEDGETALDLLESDSFDVVITDIVMGEVDGIEVLHTARLQSYRPEVILLTGHGTLETAVAALRSGAADYLLKPCAEDELLRSVEQAVQQHHDEHNLRDAAALIKDFYASGRQQRRSALEEESIARVPSANENSRRILQVGELVIGQTRHEVVFRGKPLQLTPIEFMLLRFLAETPGQVRSYSEIVHRTHHFSADDAESQMLVKQHVRNLRKKLGVSYLENDRGFGYKLVAPDQAESSRTYSE